MDINQQELANLVQRLITEALVKGGVIPSQDTVEEEAAAVTPIYLVTVDGIIVNAPIADDCELDEVIDATLETNENAKICVYELNEELGVN